MYTYIQPGRYRWGVDGREQAGSCQNTGWDVYRWCREGTGGSRQGPVRTQGGACTGGVGRGREGAGRTQGGTCTGGVGRGREGAGRVLSEHRVGRVQVV